MLTIPLEDIIVALRQLHPPPLNLVPPLIFNYQLEHIFILDRILLTIHHLFSGGFFGMVYKHLLRCFIPKDPSLGFSELF
jgi:hypothetical protein